MAHRFNVLADREHRVGIVRQRVVVQQFEELREWLAPKQSPKTRETLIDHLDLGDA
jgi:hypothetical protein